MRIHISLNVQSIDHSTRFYAALFGAEPSKQHADYANFRLDEPPIHLALQQGGSTGQGGVSHVGVELPDHETLDSWQRRLEEAGVQIAPENDAQCCYARADKLWLTDPDGYRWEIWVRTGDHQEMGATRVDLGERATACC